VLLFPYTGDLGNWDFRVLNTAGAAPHFAVDHPEGTDHVLFGEAGKIVESNGITFNGASALIRYRDDKPISFAAAKTLTLKVAERSLVQSDTARDVEGNF
jgi:hypothetical protein